jgi:hypothetical protein
MLRAIMSDSLVKSTPQFGTAEYAGVPGTELCQFCHQGIGSRYYRVNDAMACAGCAERVRFELPKDTHSRFVRGLLFGIGGAIVGLILYATFEIVTGLIIGYVSLAVGYIVAKAIKMGSRGSGGKKYQIAAVVLTYAAVSLAAVPVALSVFAKQHGTRQTQSAPPSATQDGQQGESEQPASSGARMGFGEALVRLGLLGLASPFLELASDGFHGLIGLIILGVGLKIAWRITAGSEVEIYGPFENAVAASASS